MNLFIVIAAALCLGVFSLFDFLITLKRVEKYGSNIELNPVTRFFIRKFGLMWGSALGIMGVSFLILGSLIALNWDHALSAFLGARAMFFAVQGKSLQLERELERKTLQNASQV